MPIFEDAEGIYTVQIGDGDIGISAGWVTDHPELGVVVFLRKEEKEPIGTENESTFGKTAGECGVALKILITNEVAADVLVHQIERAKTHMKQRRLRNADSRGPEGREADNSSHYRGA